MLSIVDAEEIAERIFFLLKDSSASQRYRNVADILLSVDFVIVIQYFFMLSLYIHTQLALFIISVYALLLYPIVIIYLIELCTINQSQGDE